MVTVLMLWTAFASVFSLLLGYSRVPYAAALEGDFQGVREACTRSITFHMCRCSGSAGRRPPLLRYCGLPTSWPRWS